MRHRIMIGLVLCTISLWALTIGAAFSAIGDMPFSTLITNEVVVNYTDAQGVTTFDTNNSANTTVNGIAGDTMTTPSDGSIAGAGGYDTISYTVYNTGNSAETFAISISIATYDGGADSWDFMLQGIAGGGSFTNNVDSGSSPGGTIIIGPITEDGSATFTLTIRTATEMANSPDGSYGTFTVMVLSGAEDSTATNIVVTTQYTGDNDTTYAEGDMHDSDRVAAAIVAPAISVTKSITSVSSPGGAIGYVIPGASLTYTVTIANTGSGPAKSVIVFDTVPYTTNPGDLVEFDSMTKSDTWVAYWATDASAPRTYVGAADAYWFNFATNPPAGFPSTDTGNVRFIKWETANYGGSGSSSQTFVVTVN